MADIDIQRKGPAIWPWIIGLLVLGLLTWALLEMFDTDEVVEEPVATAVDPAPVAPAPAVGDAGDAGGAAVPAAVQQYLTTCAPREPGAMGLDHQSTSGCIRQLVDAVEAVLQDPARSGIDVQAPLQAARQQAQQLEQSANQSAQHAGMTRDAFVSIATLLNSVQDARYPGLEGQAAQLEEAARSVQASDDLLDQREPVQRFFRQAGDLLNAIASSPAPGA